MAKNMTVTPITNGKATTNTSATANMSTETATAKTTSSANSSANNNVTMDAAKLNGHQQEQELFLQAFEKPTQIYRFLRNRHASSPIFLNRTLSYMKDRMLRNHKQRANFKVNSILETVTQKLNSVSNNFLNIVFLNLFDNSCTSDLWWNAGDKVQIEATLYKITKSKRKDRTSDFQEISTFNTHVVYKATERNTEFSTFNIPLQSISSLGDQFTMYKLLFRIKILEKETNQEPNTINSAKGNNSTNTKAIEHEKEDAIKKLQNLSNSTGTTTPISTTQQYTRIYGCELIIVEKSIGCIPEGEYETALQELNTTANNVLKSFSPKKRTWESMPRTVMLNGNGKYDIFNISPVLKFRLIWSAQQIPKIITTDELAKYGIINDVEGAIKSITAVEHIKTPVTINNKHTQQPSINNNNNSIQNKNNNNCNKIALTKEKIQIVYNFLYSNNTHQQTEYTQELLCPWCSLDCLRLYALLKHLKLCHARFNFTYQPATVGNDNGARIDVTINDAYDGSYAGSPYDLAGPSGSAFPRTCGPVRRTTVTNLLVCRPRRLKTCLEEFLVLDEDELSNQRPYITGHNRLYHHTETCLPVHPKELDIDSEGESDPLWLRQKTIQMIDEFSDVNEGEKELMKLWNLHVMKHGYVGDCQLPLACDMFLEVNGNEIIRKNLYRNFILHMCSLFDYGLVSAETVFKTVQKLQSMLSKYTEGLELMSRQRETQLKYWLSVGIHKQDELKLQKSPQKTLTINSSNSSNSSSTSNNNINKSDLLQPQLRLRDICSTDSGRSSSNTSTSNGNGNSQQRTSSPDLLIMLPPVKRSAPAIKRASIVPTNGNGNVSESKGVAKKSAINRDINYTCDNNTTDDGGNNHIGAVAKRERRAAEQQDARRNNTLNIGTTRRSNAQQTDKDKERNGTNTITTAASSSASATNGVNGSAACGGKRIYNNNNQQPTVKRRLLDRDNTPPSAKRQRSSSQQQQNSSSSDNNNKRSQNSTRTKTGSSSHNKTNGNETSRVPTNNHKLLTRRKSLGTETAAQKSGSITLRTRLSVPSRLSKKRD